MFQLDAPIVTYRAWFIRKGWPIQGKDAGPLGLFSLTSKTPWLVGENKAECIRPSWAPALKGCYNEGHTEVPDKDCMCGLHGVAHIDKVGQWVYGPMVHYVVPHIVKGAILQWGNMFSGGNMIRSEYAEVLLLAGTDNKIITLGKMYDVPVVPENGLQFYATEQYDELTDEQIKELRPKNVES